MQPEDRQPDDRMPQACQPQPEDCRADDAKTASRDSKGFEILYEEGPCLVVAKPPAVLTQAPPQIDSLELRIKRYLKAREGKPGKLYLGVPHRLDRPVSGVMVFARHVRATRRLAEQFAGRTVQKVYWALVEGTVESDQGTWSDHLRKVPGEARAEVVSADHAEGRLAELDFQVLRRQDGLTWLALQLHTGRTHQIRIQAASRGWPILGDRQYGSERPFGPDSADPREGWIALHARTLAFRHPMTREPVDQTAALPDAWPSWVIGREA